MQANPINILLDSSGNVVSSSKNATGVVFSVGTDPTTTKPHPFALSQNYPNPFGSGTTISYSLPEAAEVSLTVHDLLGRRVGTLIDGFRPAGLHNHEWDAAGIASGIYFYRLRAGERVAQRSLHVVR